MAGQLPAFQHEQGLFDHSPTGIFNDPRMPMVGMVLILSIVFWCCNASSTQRQRMTCDSTLDIESQGQPLNEKSVLEPLRESFKVSHVNVAHCDVCEVDCFTTELEKCAECEWWLCGNCMIFHRSPSYKRTTAFHQSRGVSCPGRLARKPRRHYDQITDDATSYQRRPCPGLCMDHRYGCMAKCTWWKDECMGHHLCLWCARSAYKPMDPVPKIRRWVIDTLLDEASDPLYERSQPSCPDDVMRPLEDGCIVVRRCNAGICFHSACTAECCRPVCHAGVHWCRDHYCPNVSSTPEGDAHMVARSMDDDAYINEEGHEEESPVAPSDCTNRDVISEPDYAEMDKLANRDDDELSAPLPEDVSSPFIEPSPHRRTPHCLRTDSA